LISFICPTIRPENWKRTRDQIAFKNYDFEVIFIGPKKSFYSVPKNSRFIRTYVKPSQCFQIGVLNSKYDYICLIADDLIFKKKNFLKEIYKNIDLVESKKKLLSLKVISFGVKLWKKNAEFKNLSIPLAAVIKKEWFYKYRGIDSRFIATYHDLDLYLRLLEAGFKNHFLNVIALEEKRKILMPSLYNKFSNADKLVFKRLWFKNEIFFLKRRTSIKRFVNFNILKKTTYPYGKWKNTNFFFNFFKYNFFYYLIVKIFTLDFNFIYNFYIKNKNNYFIKKIHKFFKKLFY
jgi:hypothetical protein